MVAARMSWPRQLLVRPINRHLLCDLTPMLRQYWNTTASVRWLCGEARNQPSAHWPITTWPHAGYRSSPPRLPCASAVIARTRSAHVCRR